MGGMGFIENNKAECMLSVLINTNLLRACVEKKIKKYFFSSSACVYNASKQEKTFIDGLKERKMLILHNLKMDMAGKNYLVKECVDIFMKILVLETRVARYHNVYGPLGTYDGGKRKSTSCSLQKSDICKN